MDKHLKHRINAGRVAVKNQVAFFRKQFGRVSSDWKDDDTRVTFADFAISENVFAELRRSFPDDDFCSEEGSPLDEVLPLRSKFAWMLDPIDGTNNYALGIPICGISLALLRLGEPIYGFLYDMSRDQLLEGGPGLGLFQDNERVAPKERPFDKQSLVGLSFPLPPGIYERLEPLLTNSRIRSTGSGALNLAYSTLGILEGSIDFKTKAWDIAAGYAFAKAVGHEFHFLEKEIFPMQEFHVSQPRCPYITGSKAFTTAVREWLA